MFVATTVRLAGLPLAPTMLWTGQALNALHGLSVAALATYLWRRPIAGVVAALVVGLLSIMPAYYVSWGRYTQLTGLLLLPPLVAARCCRSRSLSSLSLTGSSAPGRMR